MDSRAFSSAIADVSQKGCPACFVSHSKWRTVVERVADVEPDHAPFCRELLQEVVGHVAGDVIQAAQPVVGGDDRMGAHLQRLRQRLVGRVRDVDDHAEPVHLADDGPAVFGEAVPASRRAAGVGVLVPPVVSGELHDPEPQPVERPQHVEVAVEIEAALEIEDRGHFPGPVDPLDVGGIERELHDLAVLLELIDRHVHQAERLLRLIPCGVVLLHHEERHEEGVDASFLHARQVHLTVGKAIPDVPAQVELAVDHVDVPVEDEGFLVQPAGLLRHPGRLLRLRGQQQDEWNGRGDELGFHRSLSCARWTV